MPNKLFSGKLLKDFLFEYEKNIQRDVKATNNISEGNIDILSDKLAIKYSLSKIILEKDKTKASIVSVTLAGTQFPRNYDVHPGQYYPVEIPRYKIPCSGSITLLDLKHPFDFIDVSELYISDFNIVVEVKNFNNLKGNDIAISLAKGKFLEIINRLEKIIDEVNIFIEKHNESLSERIKGIYKNKLDDDKLKSEGEDDLNPFK